MGESVTRPGKGVRVRELLVSGVVRRIDVDQVESRPVSLLEEHERGEVVPPSIRQLGSDFPSLSTRSGSLSRRQKSDHGESDSTGSGGLSNTSPWGVA